MGRWSDHCRQPLGKLLLLLLLWLWLGTGLRQGRTWSCEGASFPPDTPRSPLQGSHSQRNRLRNYLSYLASVHVEPPITRTLTFHPTGCRRTVGRNGNVVLVLQFPGGFLQTLVERTSWELEQAELHVQAGVTARVRRLSWLRRRVLKALLSPRGTAASSFSSSSSPRSPMPSSNVVSDLMTTKRRLSRLEAESLRRPSPRNVTGLVREWMRDCRLLKGGRRHLELPHGADDIQLQSDGDEDCTDLTSRTELRVTVKERRPEGPRPKRTSMRTCHACHRHPILVNVSEFVSGFHPDSARPDGMTELYYCHGSCSTPHNSLVANQWTEIKSMAHLEDPSFPAPYCAAVEWGNLTGVEIQQDNTSYSYNVSDVVVTKCKCL